MIGGLAAVGDGVVRVLSVGFLHTSLQLEWSRLQTKQYLNRLKKKKQ